MQCTSLASDGSDFIISSISGAVTGASGLHCNNGFDMDSIFITLSAPLSPGNYSIVAQNGSDNNTLLDDCERQIPVGENLSVYSIASQFLLHLTASPRLPAL